MRKGHRRIWYLVIGVQLEAKLELEIEVQKVKAEALLDEALHAFVPGRCRPSLIVNVHAPRRLPCMFSFFLSLTKSKASNGPRLLFIVN